MSRPRIHEAGTSEATTFFHSMAASSAFPQNPVLLKKIVNNLLVRLNEMRAGLGDDLQKYVIKQIATYEHYQSRTCNPPPGLAHDLEQLLIAVAYWSPPRGKHDPWVAAIHLELTEKFLREIQFPTDPNDRMDRSHLIREHQQTLLAKLQLFFCRCRPRTQFFDAAGKPLFFRGKDQPKSIQDWARHLVARHHSLTAESLRNLVKPSRRHPTPGQLSRT